MLVSIAKRAIVAFLKIIDPHKYLLGVTGNSLKELKLKII